MKEVYLLRHGEKNAAGILSRGGEQAARDMRGMLPHFASVVSSKSDRAILTAKLLTGQEPRIDRRAGYSTTSPAISNAIDSVARDHNTSYLNAARLYNDPEVLIGIDKQAHELNAMIDELLHGLGEDEKSLIVSHDLTITPAMEFRGIPAQDIGPLGGYVVSVSEGLSSVRRY